MFERETYLNGKLENHSRKGRLTPSITFIIHTYTYTYMPIMARETCFIYRMLSQKKKTTFNFNVLLCLKNMISIAGSNNFNDSNNLICLNVYD